MIDSPMTPNKIEDMPSFDQFKMKDQQRALYEELRKKDKSIAAMYLGALLVLQQPENPDRFAQASHSIRELMEKIPSILDVQIPAHKESLKAKIIEIQGVWTNSCEKTCCYDEKDWAGIIDRPLRNVLVRISDFFKWFTQHYPRRKAEIAHTLRELDGRGRILPNNLEKLNIEYWVVMRGYFISVSHHGSSPESIRECPQWIEELERFLLDRLRPRTFADFDVIDALIKERGQDA